MHGISMVVAKRVQVGVGRNQRKARHRTYWPATCCVDVLWKIPAPDICDAIKKAATTAGTLISLRN